MKRVLLPIVMLFLVVNTYAQETIMYKSIDRVKITADLYAPHKSDATFIILFHQAGWSRGEYMETAPRLNDLGYNCMAVDQRSGGEINNVINKTKLEAEKEGKQIRYIDAYDDIVSSVKYVKINYPKAKVVVWGSSYSSALVLRICGDFPELVDGVLSFSPGEYFEKQGKTNTFIQDGAKNISIPVFITSAKDEKIYWEKIFNAIPSKDKYSFLPDTKGNHGSRALWKQFEDNEDYWDAVETFLNKYF